MYQYMILNEHSLALLEYAKTEDDAKMQAEALAVKYGSQRISVWKREGTLESKRIWE